MSVLNMRNPHISFTTFLRDNLEYHCLDKQELEEGLDILVADVVEKKLEGVAIVYCATTKNVETYCGALQYRMRQKSYDTTRVRKYHGKVKLILIILRVLPFQSYDFSEKG
eukprot:UN24620